MFLHESKVAFTLKYDDKRGILYVIYAIFFQPNPKKIMQSQNPTGGHEAWI